MSQGRVERVEVLCSKDAELMHEFSRRSIERLKNRFMFEAFLSIFEGFIEENVNKEIEKDGLVIENAARLFDSGRLMEDDDIEQIFEETKNVDRRFLKRLSASPLFIEVDYESIAGIRKERIGVISGMVYELLRRWDEFPTFFSLVKGAYPKSGFRDALYKILHLYCIETRALQGSVRFIDSLQKVKEHFIDTLFSVMEAVAAELPGVITGKIYRDKEN